MKWLMKDCRNLWTFPSEKDILLMAINCQGWLSNGRKDLTIDIFKKAYLIKVQKQPNTFRSSPIFPVLRENYKKAATIISDLLNCTKIWAVLTSNKGTMKNQLTTSSVDFKILNWWTTKKLILLI